MCSQEENKAYRIIYSEHSSCLLNKVVSINLPADWEQPPALFLLNNSTWVLPAVVVKPLMIHKKSRSMFMAVVPKCHF